jgi:hypothetical protein
MLQKQQRGPSAYGTGKGPEPCREKSHWEAYDEWYTTMIKNYLKIAFRQLRKQKCIAARQPTYRGLNKEGEKQIIFSNL